MTDFDAPTGDSGPRGSQPRRTFIRLSFGTAIAATIAGGVALVFDFLRPTRPETQGVYKIGRLSDFPRGGDPVFLVPENFPARMWVTNLAPDETRLGGSGGGDGLLAVWAKCTHLGCTLQWRPNFEFNGDKGWYRCACHSSTYTKAGVRVYGPAPRSLDTFEVRINRDGNVFVNSLALKPGGLDKPMRAIKAVTQL